ncbi:MAG: cytosolic protein [Gemmatimonadetes bacterium]|nr:cytosolic protein [Gemmatimonadota bacterium]|tara:strand:- start:3640 stop:3909 length:270 start_codon:yes stop_codon:yes gene_type:complete
MAHTNINKSIVNRLARIEGQVKSLRAMVESGRDCSEVLIQVAAARAALDQAGRLILEDHMEHCILEAVDEGRGQEALDDLKVTLKRFIR